MSDFAHYLCENKKYATSITWLSRCGSHKIGIKGETHSSGLHRMRKLCRVLKTCTRGHHVWDAVGCKCSTASSTTEYQVLVMRLQIDGGLKWQVRIYISVF